MSHRHNYGVTVSTLLFVTLSEVPEIVTFVLVVTVNVVIVKVADFCPAGTVTLVGTLATDALLLCKETGCPALQAE